MTHLHLSLSLRSVAQAAALTMLVTTALGACAGRQRAGALPAALLEQERFDEAVAAYRAQLEATPGDAAARRGYDAARRAAAAHHHLKAKELEGEHRLGEAVGEAENAVGLDPELEAARFDLSRLRRQYRLVARKLAEGQATLGAGDCVRARSQAEAIDAYRPTFPGIEALRHRAMEVCFDAEMKQARRFHELGDFDRARRYLDQADALFPKHGDVAELRREVERKQECRRRFVASSADLTQEAYRSAADGFRGLLKRCPEHEAGKQGLQSARRLGLQQSLSALTQPGAAADPLKTLLASEGALALGLEQGPTRAQLEQTATAQRVEVAARLYAAGERAERDGLAGAAWVRFHLAERVGRGFADAKDRAAAARKRAASESVLAVSVPPFDNEGPFPWLGKELGRELAQALREELGDAGVQVSDGYSGHPAAVVAGTVESFTIELPEPRVAPRPMEIVEGVRKETNPELGAALARWSQARRLVADHPGDGKAQQAASEAREVLAGTAAVLQTQVRRKLEFPVATVAIVGRSSVQVRISDRVIGNELRTLSASAEYRSEDAHWVALPAAGVEAHPATLPDPTGVRRRLILELVTRLKTDAAAALREHGAARLVAQAEQAKGEEAVHYLALAVLAGGDAAGPARELLRKRVGYTGTERGYDLDYLSL